MFPRPSDTPPHTPPLPANSLILGHRLRCLFLHLFWNRANVTHHIIRSVSHRSLSSIPDSCLPPRLSLRAGHLSERRPRGPVSVAVTAAPPDSLNPGEIRIPFEKVMVRKLQVIPDAPRGNRVAAAQ